MKEKISSWGSGDEEKCYQSFADLICKSFALEFVFLLLSLLQVMGQ